MFSVLLYSQESRESNWALKLNIAQLIDVVSYPTLQVSVERKINPYFSVNAEFGYQLYSPDTELDTIMLRPRGFKANIEGRVYLLKLINKRPKSRVSELFLGIQVFYRENQTTKYLEYTPLNNDSEEYIEYEDYFGVKRKAKGFNVIVGNQISIKRFIIEPFLGFGLLNRNVKNTNIEYDKAKHEILGNHNFFVPSSLAESSGNLFNFTYGLRVGFRL